MPMKSIDFTNGNKKKYEVMPKPKGREGELS
jgi:hypothetical protein|nr:MAG: hypothetical protein [Bacteriophage sp.]